MLPVCVMLLLSECYPACLSASFEEVIWPLNATGISS